MPNYGADISGQAQIPNLSIQLYIGFHPLWSPWLGCAHRCHDASGVALSAAPAKKDIGHSPSL